MLCDLYFVRSSLCAIMMLWYALEWCMRMSLFSTDHLSWNKDLQQIFDCVHLRPESSHVQYSSKVRTMQWHKHVENDPFVFPVLCVGTSKWFPVDYSSEVTESLCPQVRLSSPRTGHCLSINQQQIQQVSSAQLCESSTAKIYKRYIDYVIVQSSLTYTKEFTHIL